MNTSMLPWFFDEEGCAHVNQRMAPCHGGTDNIFPQSCSDSDTTHTLSFGQLAGFSLPIGTKGILRQCLSLLAVLRQMICSLYKGTAAQSQLPTNPNAVSVVVMVVLDTRHASPEILHDIVEKQVIGKAAIGPSESGVLPARRPFMVSQIRCQYSDLDGWVNLNSNQENQVNSIRN
jgi:hypothetical protein